MGVDAWERWKGDAKGRGDRTTTGLGGSELIWNLLQLPPTTAPRGAMMVSAPTVTPTAPAVRSTSRTGITKHTDIEQSRVIPTLPLVVAAVAVEAVVLMVPAPLEPPAMTVTATPALGEFDRGETATKSSH
jgi:hypothetical protein